MPKLRRLLIIGICTIFLIVACNRSPDPSKSDRTISKSLEFCRLVKHQLGETCIPTNPQRIIATDEDILEILLALGLKPIAAAEPNLVGSRSRHLAGKIDDVVSLGKQNQLSLERILQLNPDLILGSDFSLENNYDQFSQIAPTVALNLSNHDAWKTTLQRAGEILSRGQQAQQELENYQNRVEKLQRAMGDRLDKTEVSVVRFYADGNVEFRDSSSFPGSVLKDVGLPRPPVQQQGNNSDVTYQSVSLERLDLLDGDVIFVALDAGAKESFTKFQQEPLWQKLKAVQSDETPRRERWNVPQGNVHQDSDRVFIVDSGYWIFGNVLAANAILDDLFKYLVNSTSVLPTPVNSA